MSVMWPATLAGFARINKGLEGVKNFIYLDRLGLPTTGIGCLLRTVEQALRLPWMRADGMPATGDEIAAEWTLVRDHQELAGRVAEHALKLPREGGAGPLRLTPPAVAALVQQLLDATVTDLARQHPALAAYPAAAQLALLLGAWAYGTASPYPLRDAAIKSGDWGEAAAQSAIKGNPPRSEVIHELYLQAGRRVAMGLDPSVIEYVG